MKIQDIASLISIRNFMVMSIDNLNINLSRERLKAIQQKITYLDSEIITAGLKLDLAKLDEPDTISYARVFESTEDVEKVAEKFIKKEESESADR